MNLVIVESPTKAKTLTRFLGKEYVIEASRGHVRDIPGNKMNIDIDNDFEPVYEVVEGRQGLVAELAKKAAKASGVYLAMDPDREGEAIAYHVHYLLTHDSKGKKTKLNVPFKRITFHQITKAAVEQAIAKAGSIDDKLVDAQQARRVLDRLVGYSLSPVLWRKVRRGLSAGRVQSVALRLVVEREREIEAFKPQEFWEIKSLVSPQKEEKSQFWVSLFQVGKDKIENTKEGVRQFLVNSKQVAEPIIIDLKTAHYQVESVVKKEKKQYPKPPYTTSTLQQAAANSLGWTGKRAMAVAQQLYEKGLITYHRTDSLHLAPEAVAMVREFVESKYGQDYLPEKPNFYKTKSKSAQEAHEAIRPTDVSNQPTAQSGLDTAQAKLYGLIWKKFVASQMVPAIFDATIIVVLATKAEREYRLKATGAVMKFAGWRRVYGAGAEGVDLDDVLLPEVSHEQRLDFLKLEHEQKFTEPPPRYNDASLVKELERLGIGRPSTYAPTIGTLITRGYMERIERRYHPSAVGMTVTDFLVKNFDSIMEYGFTANMEDELDKIAEGKRKWVPVLKEFWQPFHSKVESVADKAERVQIPVEKLDEPCPECGKESGGELVIRSGRFGKFISCSRFPDCKHTARIENKIKMKCPECKEGDIVIKRSKKGRNFFGCNRYPECDYATWNDPRQPGAKAGKSYKTHKTTKRKSTTRKSATKKTATKKAVAKKTSKK